MTLEEKQLLLIELCAGLPYFTMVLMGDGAIEPLDNVNVYTYICNGLKGLPKPFLRPLSSMTEEEKTLMAAICLKNAIGNVEGAVSELSDFYNSRHFDYRGLIPMGLALEAPKDMYKTE